MEQADALLDSFPKYLLHNAEVIGERIAMRHKDRGIWHSWTWRRQRDEIRDFAVGLQALGLLHGERVAIIGANRPKLHWAVCAVQSVGGIPVPVYADAVADELSHVLSHAGIRIAVVQDQEQVDKLQGFADRLTSLTAIIYDEPRGLRDYDMRALHDFEDVQAMGRAAQSEQAGLAARWEEGICGASGDTVSIMLYTSGTTGRSKGVMLKAKNALAATRDTVRFDRLTERDSVLAYLPLAWVGDHYLNYAQGYVSGFCMACPESQQTVRHPQRRDSRHHRAERRGQDLDAQRHQRILHPAGRNDHLHGR